MIESHKIPTLVAGTVLDIMSKVTPPRAVFVDHPVGRTFGEPHDRPRSEKILSGVLAELPRFAGPGEIRDPGFQWEPGGGRGWEEELKNEMLRER